LVASYIPDKEDNPHIHFIIEHMPRQDLLSLYSSCSCYVSTERACGWGMPQMEMMAMGKPVISVNWGGPTEFMDNNNAFLIEPDSELEVVHSELQRTRPIHYSGHKWAKVTKQNVRKTMREAFENRKKREGVALQAKLDMKNKFSIQVISEQIKARLFA
jgi:glycosyltransferase involved in cell wall biosynthesis